MTDSAVKKVNGLLGIACCPECKTELMVANTTQQYQTAVGKKWLRLLYYCRPCNYFYDEELNLLTKKNDGKLRGQLSMGYIIDDKADFNSSKKS